MKLLHGVIGASRESSAGQLRSMHAAMGSGTPHASLEYAGGRGKFSAPLVAARAGLAVAFDGWIYNRADFGPARGDAEIFLDLIERHGFEGALARINGDFAIAAHDDNAQVLYLARDRFGLKPLYHCRYSDGWAFSSRPRALLALPGVPAAVNGQYVALYAGSHYRTFDNAPERSPFESVDQLPAAHFLAVRGGKATLKRYWTLQGEPDYTASEGELAEQYRALMIDSVALRVARAGKPAFTLSGGMDSSSVLASAVKSTGRKQQAISTVYVDKTYDESEDIRSMLDATVEKWTPVEVGDLDVFDLLPEIIEKHEEPVATATWLSHYILCGEASRLGFGSLFGGLGGDELNAGEYEHYFYFFADLRAAGLDKRYDDEVRLWAHYHDHPIFKKSPEVAAAHLARVTDLAHPGVCLPDRSRIDRYIATLDPACFDLAAFIPAMDNPFRSYLKNRTYQDMVRETVPCCLRAEERQSAAFGMDNFLPFFDHRLVEFMFRVPSTLKYNAGVSKSLLREAMRGVLPEETRTRIKKTGWNAPAHRWFSGQGRTRLLDLIGTRAFRERGIYNVPEVLRLLDEHEKIVSENLPMDNHMMFFWQLVNLELWLRWVDGLGGRQA